MRAERRQELKSNEFAEQIEQVKAYTREHRTTIAVVVVGAIVVFGGATWFSNNLETRRHDGWQEFQAIGRPLGVGAEPPDVASQIDNYTALAGKEIEPALTLAAWLAVGDVARDQMLNPPITGTTESRDWRRVSEDAYQRVLSDFPDKTQAVGAAMMALGALAEDSPDFDAARSWYTRVIEDPRFEGAPFGLQAEFRLEHLEEWAVPIAFAPPIVGPIAPDDALGLSPDFGRLPPGIRPPLSLSPSGSVPVGSNSDGVKIDRLQQLPFSINEIAPAGDSTEPPPPETREKSDASAKGPTGAGDAKAGAKETDPPAGAADAGASQGGGTP